MVFGAGAIALLGATQFNVVLLRRFTPQSIMVWALGAASLAGATFVGVSLAHVWGILGLVLPVWAILAAMGLVAQLVGVLGNDEFALALVMTAGMVIAMFAILAAGAPATERRRDDAVPDLA